MKINSFIFSQRNEVQNDTVLLVDPIDKEEINTYLYSALDRENPRKSFFRAFKMRKSIVITMYWYTNERELGSGRTGLYVVFGFIVSDYHAMGVSDGLMWFCNQYFQLVEEYYQISLNEEYGDQLFIRLQDMDDPWADRLLSDAFELRCSIPNFHNSLNLVKMYVMRKRHIKGKSAMIYLLNGEETFIDRWSAFCKEALKMLRMSNCWDISTLPGYTPQSITIYENGSYMPSNFTKVVKVKDGDLQYLVMWD